MRDLIQQFKDYLDKVLGVEVSVRPWQKSTRLPLFLRERYSFYECALLDHPFVLMVTEYEEGDTPAVIRKHTEKVMEIGDDEVIYVNRSVASFNRKRLIEQRVSFVVPGNQLYLPSLGVDLREHIRKSRRAVGKLFTPSAQAVVLHAIYFGCNSENGFTPKELSRLLNYSSMTLSRAFDEFETVGIGEVSISGRERILQFSDNKEELWKKAKPYLRSPVQRIVAADAKDLSDYPLAGFSALSHYTMLAGPQRAVHALSLGQWKGICPEGKNKAAQIESEDVATVEIWSYKPLSVGLPRCVDPLSLHLSITEQGDERVEASLEQLLGSVSWILF